MERWVKTMSICAAVLLPAFGGCVATPAADDASLRRRVERAVAEVYPALVKVHVVVVDYEDGRENKYESAGSGVIISPEGHVVTNHHVAGKAKRIRCVLPSREIVEARLIGTDALSDIAVLQLLPPEDGSVAPPFPMARFADSDALRVGDRVLAMGSPLALSQSVTLGIVSNTELVFPELFWPLTLKLDGEEVGTLVRWIGHDAEIYPGNSGGPLVNLEGQIVGINEIKLGLSGAIPSNLVREVIDAILADREVVRSDIGLTAQPLLRGSGRNSGVLVAEVLEGTPAFEAGIRPGDVIVRVDGRPVTVRFPEQLPPFNRDILGRPVGSEVELVLVRAGEERTVRLVTERRQPIRGRDKELSEWGVTVRALTPTLLRELGYEPLQGAYVTSVRPGGAGGEAKPPLQRGDVVVKVNEVDVEGPEHLARLGDALLSGREGGVPAVVSYRRRQEALITVLVLGHDGTRDRALQARKAWFPAGFQVFTREMAAALGLDDVHGVRITQVFAGDSVAEAGLQVGDVITHLDGERVPTVRTEEADMFVQLVRQFRPGDAAELTVRRPPSYEEQRVSVTLPLSPPPARRMPSYRDPAFEFEARDLAYVDRTAEAWKRDESGVLVTSVRPGSWAALAHLGTGDLLLSVDGEPVPDVAALKTVLARIKEAQKAHITLFVRRGVHTHYLELEPDWGSE